ncbi:MAG: phosphatase domain-containing protein, partial [Bdellovibrionota bacterium]
MESKQPSLLLLSDLDDTIKISNTTSKLVTVYRGLFRSSAFIGMAQLYEELLLGNPGSEFHIVSSSPPAIRKKIEYFLAKNKFPPAKLTLRDWLRQTSIPAYKRGAILELIEKSESMVVLIGDDTEHDPEVFAAAAEKFPDKVVA